MPSRHVLLSFAFLAAAAAPAFATGRLVDVQIVDRTQGQTLPLYRQRGTEWIAGQPGNRYAVQLVNRTGARVLVVLSVDGVNAVTGETAATGQTGYVLGPYASTEITGWRKNEREAAAFYFTSLADSYAARTDRPDNVGVIGAAVFRERVRLEEPRDVAPYSWNGGRRDRAERESAGAAGQSSASADAPKEAPGAAPARSADAAAGGLNAQAAAPESTASPTAKRDSRLGTGHGEREWSPVTRVAFERASSLPAELVRVRYDSWRNLVALGVVGAERRDVEPDAFPRWVPDPR